MELTRADIKNFKDKKFKKQNGLFMLEGDKFCLDALHLNVQIERTITTNKNLSGFPNISVVPKSVFDSLSSTRTPQSIICICKIAPCEIASIGNALVLDRVQDPGNVGTLIRSALAFNFKDVYLIDCADAYSEKVIRSSAGQILNARLHIVTYSQFEQAKSKIAEIFMVADMEGESLTKIRLPKKRIAVIIGNEGQGVSNTMRALANKTVSIPMSNGVESLNAAVSGSIIMQKISEV